MADCKLGLSHPTYLVGGFNPFEKYARQIGNHPHVGVISPQFSVESPPCRLYSIRTLVFKDFLSCQETRFAAVWEAKLHETQRWLALPLKYLISLNPKKSTKLSQEQVIATLEVQINYLLNGFSAKTSVLLV